jgi:hypothetical protein
MQLSIHDFEARVRFLTPEEGGLRQTPTPGYRCSFMYEGQAEKTHWMVFPVEFFTQEGDLPDGVSVPTECFARFRILDSELAKNYHKPKLKEGIRFEMYEAHRRIGVGEVTKLVGICDR